jgi:hypothetical protein
MFPAVLAAAVGVASVAMPAAAQEVFAGVAAHDIDLGITACCAESGADVQAGVRSAPLGRLLGGEVRGYAFGSVNTGGGLDFGAAGLALRYPFARERLYVQGGLGVAYTDGSRVKFQASPDRLYLGSRLLFEPEITLGWRVSERWALEGSYVHLSHAQLAGRQNPGTDMLGLRVAYRLGR